MTIEGDLKRGNPVLVTAGNTHELVLVDRNRPYVSHAGNQVKDRTRALSATSPTPRLAQGEKTLWNQGLPMSLPAANDKHIQKKEKKNGPHYRRNVHSCERVSARGVVAQPQPETNRTHTLTLSDCGKGVSHGI